VQACRAHPSVLVGPRVIAERKAAYHAPPFETTNRYFRGRTIEALREHSPLSVSALAHRLGRSEPAWLESLLAGLERDGLLVCSGDELRLP